MYDKTIDVMGGWRVRVSSATIHTARVTVNDDATGTVIDMALDMDEAVLLVAALTRTIEERVLDGVRDKAAVR